MKKFKYQQYFHCFIVFVLVPYVFWFIIIIISSLFNDDAS